MVQKHNPGDIDESWNLIQPQWRFLNRSGSENATWHKTADGLFPFGQNKEQTNTLWPVCTNVIIVRCPLG